MRYWYAPLENDPRYEDYYGRIFTSPDHENHAGLYVGEISKDSYDSMDARRRNESQGTDEFGLPVVPPTDEFGLPL